MSRPFKPCNYIKLNSVRYMYLNDDNPNAAYQNENTCFVAQPLYCCDTNSRNNVIVVPLMMTDEWDLIKDRPDLIKSFRNNKKKYDFNFIGQCKYMGRDIFRNLNLENYDFEETSSVYSLPKDKKTNKLLSFLHRISKSKFVFAPRGVGSSSFRAYQAMMVGSIPIITDMNDYPFQDRVDWDQISIRGNLNELNILIEKALNISDNQYKNMQKKAIDFWDNYCKHDMLYKKIKDIYCCE